MNSAQLQALQAGDLSHLVEAATALAKLTGQFHIAPTGGSQQPQHQVNNKQSRNVISDEEEGGSVKSSAGNSSSNHRGTGREIFPERLMAILNDDSLSDIITWLPHGRSFVIIRPDVFTEKVLPKYLPPVDSRGSTKYTSFTRKLNRWGFRQATRGPDTGAFHHPLFRRDKPELSLEMVCQRSRDRKSAKQTSGNLPAKKRLPPAESVKNNSTDDSIQSQSTPRQSISTTVSQVPVAVSVGPHSVSNSSSSSSVGVGVQKSSNSILTNVSKGITTDKSLTEAAIRRRNETERLRAAKAMLYESYCRALQEQ